jgi:hypothetical protein
MQKDPSDANAMQMEPAGQAAVEQSCVQDPPVQ